METGRDRFLGYLLRGTAVTDPQRLLDEDEWLKRQFGMAYLLADTRSKHDVLVFVSETLPLLLRQLRRTTRRERVTFQGQVRGRIDWPATGKARLQNDVNPALYVCRPPQRQDNTPENQLVKYLLERLNELVHDLAEELQEAELWTAVSDTHIPFNKRLAQIAFYLRQTLNHARLRAVESPPNILPSHLIKAQASKIELYGYVAHLYAQYERIMLHGDWADMRAVLGQAILLPDPATPFGDACIQLAALGFAQARQKADVA